MKSHLKKSFETLFTGYCCHLGGDPARLTTSRGRSPTSGRPGVDFTPNFYTSLLSDDTFFVRDFQLFLHEVPGFKVEVLSQRGLDRI